MPWAICILIINNFEGTKCVLDRCSGAGCRSVPVPCASAPAARAGQGWAGVACAGLGAQPGVHSLLLGLPVLGEGGLGL